MIQINKQKLFILVFSLLLLSGTVAFSQSHEGTTLDSLDKSYLNWHNLDPETNGIQGISVERAYNEILKNKVAKRKVIVAVIDGGVDIEHEDLQGKIWHNEDEIPNNGIDDDNNGFIDDMHGWNFIGNSKGENIKYENMEEVRIYRALDKIYKDITSINDVTDEKKEEYKTYIACKTFYKEELEKFQNRRNNIYKIEKQMNEVEGVLEIYLGKKDFTQKDLKSIHTSDEKIIRYKNYLLSLYKIGLTREGLNKSKEYVDEQLDKYLNIDFKPREIIGDDIEDINDNKYGNNDVKWTRSDHGTFVAGLIAATRNNNIGIDGIAESVEIMALRTVPVGDERDKDIALSIRYAVDNGANIINMSFGKNYSPQKSLVDEAVKYAEEHNVLLVHAAGNEADDIDKVERYPTDRFLNNDTATTWINVGASAMKYDKNLCGVFSNYGKKNVDIFAPGHDVLSLYPENKYLISSGTSFACPVVSGVAALVWSYYPELTALELKEIILKSTNQYPKKKVYVPNVSSNKKVKVKFETLSLSGGTVNAYAALKLAETYVKEKTSGAIY